MVVDRNRYADGGITVGIGFRLSLLAALRGERVAKITQLAWSKIPSPFKAGHPDVAGPELTEAVSHL